MTTNNNPLQEPDASIDALKMTPEERHKILVEWNQTERDYPRDKCVHRLFEEQAQRTPHAIAVEFEKKYVTYSELNSRANQVANVLRKNGVEADSLIGVCIERSVELVVALLGVWKAGGAYVPLDPMNPPERLNYMLSDSEARIVLTSVRQRHLFAGTNRRSICIDSDPSLFASESSDAPHIAQIPTDLAYVMYTSGSTGNPKGVMVTHGGLVNYVVWAAAEYSADVGESVPLHSSIAFDLTVTALWVPLIAGGSVELLPEEIGGLNLLAALRRKKERSLVKITPAHLALLAEQLEPFEAAELSNLFVIGGENLSAESLQRWRNDAPKTRLINEYGPTETVVGCCVYEVRPDDPRNGSVPIGRPIANTKLYVLDSQMNPVPPGEKGELYIGGAGVARGYWNRPELTKQKFVPDPFSGDTDARLYNSGDLARYRTDGTLEYLGRIDSQVKIRGFRVELGEIEAKLAEHPAVQASAVIVREASAGNKQIVGYLVLRQDHEVTVNDLLVELRKGLPEYMLPSRLVFLGAMPLTPNGKVDKSALPPPEMTTSDREDTFVSPRTPLEEMLARVWSSALGVDQVGIRDNFFEMGGDSLLAIRVVDAIKSSSGIGVNVADLFRHATVAELAESLSNSAPASEDSQRGEYLELIRPGNANTHLVVVGAKLRVPLEVLPPDIPGWWLKLDGLHVWPPKYLGLKSQAAIHAQELSDEIPSGQILLCGHSYGATLAIEIALQLTKANTYGSNLDLQEPPLWSTKYETSTEKIARKLNELMNRDFSQNFREYSRMFYKFTVGRVKNLMISSRTSPDHDIPVDDRWEYLEAFLRENSRRYQVSETLTHDVHLIKTRLYYEGSLERLKQIAKPSLQIHDAPDHLDHFDIAEPQHSMVWMSIVLKLLDHDAIQHSISTPCSSQASDVLAQTSATTQI